VDPAGGNVCTSECQTGSEDEELKQSAGAMYDPENLALDSQGQVFVADARNNRIDVFSTGGAFIRAFGKDVEAGPGTGSVCTLVTGCERGVPDGSAGAINRPTGVAVDAAGNVYVTDHGNARIDVFTATGDFLYAFGKEVSSGAAGGDVCTSECQAGEASGVAGAMREPYDVTIGPDGDLYVADYGNARVDVFTAQGAFLRAFGKDVNPAGGDVCTSECQAAEEGEAAGQLVAPTAVTTTASGSVYVADEANNRIDEFTASGGYVRGFGEGVVSEGALAFQICTLESGCREGGEGTIAGAVPGPYGVAVDCQGGVYAVEEKGGYARVERFGEPGTPVPSTCPVSKVNASPSQTPSPSPTPVKPSNKIKFGKLTLNKKKGTATLTVKVPGPGSLALKGKGLKKVKRIAKKVGSVKLPVALAGKAKKKLNEAGKAKVKAKLTFAPTGGSAATQAKRLTLKKTRPVE
jgi:sugar lactone lactonase YvrE